MIIKHCAWIAHVIISGRIMFLNFFYSLRQQGVPVTPQELLDFLKIIEFKSENNQVGPDTLYLVARSSMVKDIKYYDQFDKAFALCFSECVGEQSDFSKKLKEWLNKNKSDPKSPLSKKDSPFYLPDELMRELQKRLKEQQKRHQGGNKWIGTGGFSPFGHSGYNEQGIRIGGESKHRSAIATAMNRNYQNYRTDALIGVRQLKVCLKRLTLLKKTGRRALSIKKTIEKTCRFGGEIEFVYEKPRKNEMKLILLLDIGGSMTAHSQRVNQLFSACHQLTHFKRFQCYYFHNTIYDDLYLDADFDRPIPVSQVLKTFDSQTRVIFVGDAAMAPYELYHMSGAINQYYKLFGQLDFDEIKDRINNKDSYAILKEIAKKYPYSIWLNPEGPSNWGIETVHAIREVFPMFFLSLDGISQGINHLLGK